jgi:peptidoglycan/LPS O-acetylase OafA/YrhL
VATGSLGSYGYLGVSFFFCLSGFVNQWGWASKRHGTFEFLYRRVAKIYPLSLVTLFFAVFIFWKFSAPIAGFEGSKNSIRWSALLLQAWWYDTPGIRQSWNGISWTLSCEMFFYVLSPIMLPAIGKLSLRSTAIAFVGVVIAYWASQYALTPRMGPNFFEFFPISRLPEYAAGALASRFLVLNRARAVYSVHTVLLITVAAPLLLLSGLFPESYPTAMTCVAFIGFIAVIYASASNDLAGKTRATLTSRALDYLGKISYSIYMTHGLVLGCLAYPLAISAYRVETPFQGEMMRIVFIGVAIAVASAAYYGIERPVFNKLVSLLHKPVRASAR